MSGQNRIVLAEMARPTTAKGSALKAELNTETFEAKVLKVKGNEKQPCDEGEY